MRWVALSAAILTSCTRAPVDGAADVAARRVEAKRITDACGLPARTIVVGDDSSIHLRPNRDEAYQRVDCALAELRKSKVIPNPPMSFIGNERYDENMQ